MFVLRDLLVCNNIVIQCHDNPDADAIASAYALQQYLLQNGKQADIIYSGKSEITKVNLLELISLFSVPINYRTDLSCVNTLITVDSQYGAGNVTKILANTVFVIDHHADEKLPRSNGIVFPQLGSCSTLLWDLLRKEQFDFHKHANVSTALYYGLFTDTSSLSEICHPLDKDMRDLLPYDRAIIKRLQNTNITVSELYIAGMALAQYQDDQSAYAVFKAEPCDPNILGFISDLAIQVNTIDVCVVYCVLSNGAKLSVRSCTNEVMASELARFLCCGAGGGHLEKAGGFLKRQTVEQIHLTIDKYIKDKIHEYFYGVDVIRSNNHVMDIRSFAQYIQRKAPMGYVMSTDVFDEGIPVLLRMLTGDADAIVSSNLVFLIGFSGEVVPVSLDYFNANYERTDDPISIDSDYIPTARNKITGESIELVPYLKGCLPVRGSYIYAKPLERYTKVFSPFNKNGYLLGKPGDYIAFREDNPSDAYVVQKDNFYKLFLPVHKKRPTDGN